MESKAKIRRTIGDCPTFAETMPEGMSVNEYLEIEDDKNFKKMAARMMKELEAEKKKE